MERVELTIKFNAVYVALFTAAWAGFVGSHALGCAADPDSCTYANSESLWLSKWTRSESRVASPVAVFGTAYMLMWFLLQMALGRALPGARVRAACATLACAQLGGMLLYLCVPSRLKDSRTKAHDPAATALHNGALSAAIAVATVWFVVYTLQVRAGRLHVALLVLTVCGTVLGGVNLAFYDFSRDFRLYMFFYQLFMLVVSHCLGLVLLTAADPEPGKGLPSSAARALGHRRR